MDLAKHRQGVQIEHPGCVTQRDFATLGPLAVRVDRDAVRVAETCTRDCVHPFSRPVRFPVRLSRPAMALSGMRGISPLAIRRIGKDNTSRITRVPEIFSSFWAPGELATASHDQI